jgi:hypothetical protein
MRELHWIPAEIASEADGSTAEQKRSDPRNRPQKRLKSPIKQQDKNHWQVPALGRI